MTIALVQEADAASSPVTLGSATTAGNTVVVAVACLSSSASAGVTGVTLGGSPDNFTPVTPGPSARDTTSPNDYLNVAVWADANCIASNTVAVTGTGIVGVWVWEFSGLSGTPENWQVFPVPTYQSSWIAALPQTKVPVEAWIAVTAAANQTATETISVNSGFGWATQTAYTGTSGSYFYSAQAAYQTVNTVGAPAFNGTFSQPSFSATVLLALKAAPAANLPVALPGASGGGLSLPGSSVVTGNLTVHGTLTVASGPLTPTPARTGSVTASPGDLVVIDTTYAPVTVTMPFAAPDGCPVGIKFANAGTGGFTATVVAQGSDTFDLQPPGTTSLQLAVTNTTFVATYHAASTAWLTQSVGYQQPGLPSLGAVQPSDVGFVAWSYDPVILNAPFSGAAIPSDGTITLIRCPVRTTTLTFAVNMWITSGASGLTANQNFAAVYSSTGNLLGETTDQHASWGATGLYTQLFSASGAFSISPPFVWVAFLCNGTTGPSFAVTANQTAAWANGGLFANTPRFGKTTATHTSLPSSIPSLGITTISAQYWAALLS